METCVNVLEEKKKGGGDKKTRAAHPVFWPYGYRASQDRDKES